MSKFKPTLEERIIIAKRALAGETYSAIVASLGNKLNQATVGYYKSRLPGYLDEWKELHPGQPEPAPSSAAQAGTTSEMSDPPGAGIAKAALLVVKDRLRQHMRTAENPDIVYLAAQAALTAMGG